MVALVGKLWAEGISAELAAKLPKQGKPQRRKLATMVATMLKVRSANLMELASGLPTETARSDMRYQWITRLLSSDLLDCDTVMRPFVTEIFESLHLRGEPITLIMDQSKASDRHQVLMLAIAWGERALPVAWRVEETEGSIGFSTQEALLSAVLDRLPEGCNVMLMGDRFYGSPDLILWLTNQKWRYRLRLKGNLKVIHGNHHATTDELAKSGQTNFENLRLTAKRVTTHIGVIRDPGHAEPWIIAMSDAPSYLKTLEYSQRWGIENSLHWVLDMVFRDDECRLRTDHAPANFTTIKHIALNLIRRAPGKDSLRLKRKVAAWDDDFLASVITR